MNKEPQKLLFIVVNFLFKIFQFKKYENKSDFKDLTVYLFSGENIFYKLLNFIENQLAIFIKKNKGDFLKFKNQTNAIFFYFGSSTLNKNCVNFLDSFFTSNILTS